MGGGVETMNLLHCEGTSASKALGVLALGVSLLMASVLPGPIASADQADSEVSATSNERVGISNNEILFGSCAALEGPVATVGKQVVAGGKLYFDHIND